MTTRTLSGPADRPVTQLLGELAGTPPLELFTRLHASPKGLTEADAAERLVDHGENTVAAVADPGPTARLATALRSPFVGLLFGLGLVFAVLGEPRGAVTVAVMVTLSVGARLWQGTRSRRAVAALLEQVSTTATVRRRAAEGLPASDREVPLQDVVPGDVVLLAPGDLVPADVRVLTATDLAVDQSTLSGEALPVLKRGLAADPRRTAGHRSHGAHRDRRPDLAELSTVCLAGTWVVAGTGSALVLATGERTYRGSLARHTGDGERPGTSVDLGVRDVGRTLIRFMLVLVPIVLAVNGMVTGDWARAVMFAVAVAVGLTPEMLPVIVTTNLVRGALRLAERHVVVTRLNAVQDLGAADVLCVDKTGTLTEDRVVYAHSVDARGRPDGRAAEHAYLALRHQLGPPTRLDQAVRTQLADLLADPDPPVEGWYDHVDEIGFDAYRRRATVVLRDGTGEHLMITKGAPETVLARCARVDELGEPVPLSGADRAELADLVRAHAEHGMRLLAVATRSGPPQLGGYGEDDEAGLTLLGFVGFVDPVREATADAVRALSRQGVAVRILTGDNEHVARYVAALVGVPSVEVAVGQQVERATDAALRAGRADHRVRPGHPGPQGPDRGRAARARAHRGLRRGRRQRRPGPARRRRGHRRRHRHRRGQGGRRPHPAAQGPRGDRRRDHRGTADAGQHAQVRAHHGGLQRRQRADRAGRQRVPALPADAADPAGGPEPALRRRPARAALGPGGAGLPEPAPTLGRHRADPLHGGLRSGQLAVRPGDLRRAVAAVRRGRPAGAVPDRVVRRGPVLPAAGGVPAAGRGAGVAGGAAGSRSGAGRRGGRVDRAAAPADRAGRPAGPAATCAGWPPCWPATGWPPS